MEADLEANRRQRDKVQAEKAKVEAALEKLELNNRQRAEGIRQAEAAAARARAAEVAADEAKKRDIILQLRQANSVCWLQPCCTWMYCAVVAVVEWS